MRGLIAVFVFVIMITVSPVIAASGAFYVSPTGSDSHSGTSPSAPFATLEKAQTAMESQGSGPYTTYLMGGTWKRTATLNLHAANDANKTWTAYSSAIPILDGGGSVQEGFDIIEPGITIQGLTIQNYTLNGIGISNTNNVTINNNTVLNITTPSWQTGTAGSSINLWQCVNCPVTNNTVNGNTSFGINDESNGIIITGNLVLNTCTIDTDCGAIYLGPTPIVYGTDVNVVANNTVGMYGSNENGSTEGIYLDNNMSRVTATGNIIYGPGTDAIKIHGGQNNLFQNNVFDLTSIGYMGDYQDCPANQGCPASTDPMTGNVVTDNIVYSSSTPPSTMWEFYSSVGVAGSAVRNTTSPTRNRNGGGGGASAGGIALPAVSNNLNFDTIKAFPNIAPIIDSSPIIANPLFAKPAMHNYMLEPGSPAFALGFTASQ